jgi:phosphate transport system substrate-binding protein
MKTMRLAGTVLSITTALAACGGERAESSAISIDGSSTVFPITEAMAEEFGIAGGTAPTISVSGTGGGFKRFCAGETDISNASRPISDSERELCANNGVEFMEIPVAIDGLTVTVNPANDFVQCLTVDELRRMWEPNSTVNRWSQVRGDWPDTPIRYYGAGTNSGTFDYFTEAIMGEVGSIRTDFTASEDDNVLVQGVEGDVNALGFFGYAYYAENATRLRAVAIDGGAGCVAPEPGSVRAGTYTPLARPLFVYVSLASLQRSSVRDFLRFYLENAAELVPQVGYVPMQDAEYRQQLERLETGNAAS